MFIFNRHTSLIAGLLTVAMTSASPAEAGFNSAFDCGDLTGKVFDDKNRNGYQDKNEHGLPGVQLVTARGLRSITDEHGRYHVTCAQIPRGSVGSVFLLKLDARSLPASYRTTTANPRTIPLTRGKATKLNFGASGDRVVRLDLESAAFEPNGAGLRPQWDEGINQLITILDQEHSILNLVYQKGDEESSLADERLRAVSRLVKERWQRSDGQYELEIEQWTIAEK